MAETRRQGKVFALRLAAIGVGVALAVSAHAQCSLDIDGDGKVDALTDGLLLLRAARGVSGVALTRGALAPDAQRRDPTAILQYIISQGGVFDVDGDGAIDAATDGIVVLRYLFGLDAEDVMRGAVSSSANRSSWNAIQAHLRRHCPG